jgi:hypothetical protein
MLLLKVSAHRLLSSLTIIGFVKLEVLRACNTALSGGAYSEAGSTEGFLTTAEVSNLLREAEALL